MSPGSPPLPTALPADFIPTAVSLTLTADNLKLPPLSGTPGTNSLIASTTPVPLSGQTTNDSPVFTQTDQSETQPTGADQTFTSPLQSPSPEVIHPTNAVIPELPGVETPEAISTDESLPEAVTNTPAPPIPDARIQIYRLGDLSKVVSPLDVSLRLTCGDAKIVRIELLGEDGRLLGRYVREYKNLPWEATRIGISIDFEISAAAELGRLVVSAEDAYGRTIEINSMNLILLSHGTTDLNPSSGLQQQIIIQEPTEKALIQNGSLIVAGRARTESPEPLRVLLLSEDGKVLGQRLAAVTTIIPGDFGQFIAELSYEVNDVTSALLVVYEEGSLASVIIHLTSLNVTLVPK